MKKIKKIKNKKNKKKKKKSKIKIKTTKNIKFLINKIKI